MPDADATRAFFALLESQRALRRFRPEPVPLALVRRVIAAATRAPSARGAEPWGFVAVRDAATRAAIAKRYRAAWDAGEQYTAAADADRDVRERPHYERMMRAARDLAAHLADVPVLVVCCLDHAQLGPIAGEGGTLLSPVAAYASIFPAVRNLLLAAHALGLGTTLTTLHRLFEDDLRALLALPASFEPVAIVPLGWPRDRPGPTRRKPLDAVACLDRWGTRLPERG